MRRTVFSAGVVAAAVVVGPASGTTVSFATPPTPGTFSTAGTAGGTSSSSFQQNGWAPGQGAWQLSAQPLGPPTGQAVFSMAASSFVGAGTRLADAYATGVTRYASNSSVPAPGQIYVPVFTFSVSIAGANDAQISIGTPTTPFTDPGGIFTLSANGVYDDLRAREAFGFHLGALAGNALVAVSGNRSGLAPGVAEVNSTSTTWSQLMAMSTAGSGLWGNLSLTGVSIVVQGTPGTYDPNTQSNNTINLIQQFTVTAIPGSGLAAIGTLGLAGMARRRRR